jgi:hypothetical protein
MTYPFILMIVCVLHFVVGLFSKPNTNANDQGRVSFIIMFNAALIWLIVEAMLWLTR